MARSQEEKARTHERILGIAARRLREAGLNGIGVADLMKEAGLTVGGFYKHFDSRDDLVAEAVGTVFRTRDAQNEAARQAGHVPSWNGFLDEYLGTGHRDDPGSGCAFSALVSDLARADGKTRGCATAQLQRNFEALGALLGDAEGTPGRARAILAFSALVGAVSLARVADDDALSREILDTVRELLNEPVKE